MAKLLKLRRGTTTQHASFTGAEGEVTVDTSKDTAVVHDGSQAGGRPLAREDMSNVSSASIIGRLAADSVVQSKIPDGAIDEARLQISNSGSNGQYLQKQSGNTGGLTWGTVDLTTLSASNLSSGTIPDARFPSTLPAVNGANLTGIASFASGTKMIFQQTSAPSGWTKITSSVDNKALRLVSGSVGSGGNQNFTGAFAARTPAGNVGTTSNSTASFSGSVSGNTGNAGATTSSVSTSGSVSSHTLSNNQVPSHSHSVGGGIYDSYGNQSNTNLRAQYGGAWNWFSNEYNKNTSNSGGGGGHNHGFSGSSHSHNVNNHTHSFSGSFSGNTGNHTHSSGSFSGTSMDFAVKYIDVIVASKD